ncbi:hypothetical protein FIBSPDRAFT_932161 [Athelia psychrophila]|uniref:Mid2 domain-containing protein n=1 Tax=Athelia psychrophila TaxID=1759441 RepID=A0A166GA89_9AGAM|nr:hypothetical protein FIBSPDRAFT_933853 [Fibularhizoctonia sp. CBS 109695]KZP20722.1 hypothetical protein FIBSPDRAFT_932161 [Fibularhizoctonia sp. CBS 109695]
MKFQRVVSLLLLALGVAQSHARPSPDSSSDSTTTAPAMYYIDDQDPEIVWGANQWIHLTSTFAPITWAATQNCFNQTVTIGTAQSEMKRSFTVPFTGSGIILYVVYYNRAGLNATVTLDGDFETINWFVLDSDYATEASFNSYNATLYDIQNLHYGDHSLTVELQNYTGGLPSTILFDYAAVTGTRPTGSAGRNKKLGAGIGGGLGAVAVLGALALILLFVRRRSIAMQSRQPGVTLREAAYEDPFADPSMAKDPSLFNKAKNAVNSVRPGYGHNRRQSSFSHGAGSSPISPVVPAYSGGQKHPWLPLNEE